MHVGKNVSESYNYLIIKLKFVLNVNIEFENSYINIFFYVIAFNVNTCF